MNEADAGSGLLLAYLRITPLLHADAMQPELANTELKPADIPSFKENWARIQPFALSFDGFRYWGSIEKCAEIAHAKRIGSLTDLRTCLFYEAKRWGNLGKAPDTISMRYIRALVYAIREKVSLGEVR